jgi:hypothetical protein
VGEIHNFAELEKSLLYIRTEFDKSTSSVKHIIEKPINLLFGWMALIKTIAVTTDDESYILEVLTAAFRRVLSSYVLLESGFKRDSVITVRNYIELMLIAIDITYNQSSLEEWKKSGKDEIFIDSRENWYFKKSKICARIEENKENIYPEYARNLAVGKEEGKGRSLCREWNIISNIVGHEHASSQILQLLKTRGHFPILEGATAKTCQSVFRDYRLFLLDIISLLVRIPKYRDRISSDNTILEKANSLSREYDELINEILLDERDNPPATPQ